MEEKKLTDEEIIKGLEFCSKNRGCNGCPYFEKQIDCCSGKSEKDALDLIHRLQSEKAELLQVAELANKNCDELKETLKLRNIQLEDLRKYDKEIVKDTAKKCKQIIKSKLYPNNEWVDRLFEEEFGVEVE